MKLGIGILMVLGGIALGLYAGLWWAFIGGIVQIVDAVKATPVEALSLAFGIAKVVFAGAIGMFSGMVLVLPGFAFISAD